MDGTIGLGVYGSVYVTGMTLEQARLAIEMHLSQSLLEPEISLDVYAYLYFPRLHHREDSLMPLQE